MKRIGLVVAVGLALASCSSPPRVLVAAGTTLVDSGILDELVVQYEKENPDVELSVVGESTARVLDVRADTEGCAGPQRGRRSPVQELGSKGEQRTPRRGKGWRWIAIALALYAVPMDLAHAEAIEVEAVAAVLTIHRSTVPPTRNLEHADEECDLDYVAEGARPFRGRTVLSNSFGFGGQNATVIVREYVP